jgi:hypothetical protein
MPLIQSHIKPRENSQYLQKIPKKIFQTWKTNDVQTPMYNAMNNIINMNPEYEYFFFNNEECRKFIVDNFEQAVVDAYDNILPGAYKADLWRYCVLYIHGGVYLDSKTVLLTSLKTIISPDVDCMICVDRPENYLLNGIMMVTARNEYILRLISRAVMNINDGVYDREDWNIKTIYGWHGTFAVTGPYLCGKEFLKFSKMDKIEPKIYIVNNMKFDFRMEFKTKVQNTIFMGDKIIMYKSYPHYYIQSGRDNYASMYEKRKIFKKNIEVK